MSRKSLPVVLTDAEVIRLEQWIWAGSTQQQVVLRARILLAGAAGQSAQASALQLGVHRRTVALWRRRVCAQGIGCVWEISSHAFISANARLKLAGVLSPRLLMNG